MAAPTNKPQAPTVNRELSTIDSLFIEWDEGTAGDIPIIGYKLYMIEKGTGDSSLIYDGSLNSLTKRFWVQNLQTAQYYAFYVIAIDFNRESEPSDEMQAVVCVTPGHLESPHLVSTTADSIQLAWSQPFETGGCPILGYELYMSEDSGSTWESVDEISIANKPFLTGHTVTGLENFGSTYYFQLIVNNEIGPSESLPKAFVLATVPSKPPNAPIQSFDSTTKSRIKIIYQAIDPSETGGSDIIGYDLWRDDGQDGDFIRLYHIDVILSLSYLDYDVSTAQLYRYKYRARNVNGYGDFSDPGYLYAANVPSTPQPPSLIGVTDDSISLQFYSPEDTGGTNILSYILVMDEGEINSEFTQVTTYSNLGGATASLLVHTITVADGLVSGSKKIFSFKFKATNSVGESGFSTALRVALGAQQTPPANLSSNIELNGENFVHIQWDRVDMDDLDTLGYSLEVLQDDDTWIEVFNAEVNPDALEAMVYGLIASKYYTFRAYSYNFNGPSLASSYFSVYSCGLPRYFSEPLYVTSTEESIMITWKAPLENGGCPISDYEVQRDEDGTGDGPWTEVNPYGSFQRFDPYQDTFECFTFPAGTVSGDLFKFRVIAYNLQGSVTSTVSRAIPLASIPAAPANPPTFDTDETNGFQIKLTYEEVSDDGGSPLRSYELQMGSLTLTDFVSVVGDDPQSLQISFVVTRNVEKGKIYAFRYRAINIIGPGAWSEVSQLKAATRPEMPPKPTLVSATDNSVTVGLDQTTDNGGSEITQYLLYRDGGDLSTPVNIQVTDYDGFSEQYTVTGLDAGKKYRFDYVAANEFGASEESLTLTVAASYLPDPPTDIVIDWDQSSKTSLFVNWSEPANSPSSPILGYILYLDDGNGGQFEITYDGSVFPGVTSHDVQGLTNGLLYRLKAKSLNFNGLSEFSEVYSYYACTSPAQFVRPEIFQQSGSSISIKWEPPKDTGGCRITTYIIYRNDGGLGLVETEVNEVQEPLVRDRPSLNSFEITSFPADSQGNTFSIQILVRTTQREGFSDVLYAVLAGVPLKPEDVPINDQEETSDTQIKLTYASPEPDNNGSTITSYELQMDDGFSGDFFTLVGYVTNSKLTTFTATQNIFKGRQHRFKYRAKNDVGWGPFSDETAVIAARVPEIPERPSFQSFTDDQLNLIVPLPVDNGGSAIELLELWRDEGNDFTSDFIQMTNYDGISTSYAATNANDGLEPGKTYRFKTKAKNLIGYSEFSVEAYIAFGNVPNKPDAPIRLASTTTSITVEWTQPTSNELTTSGYILNMDDGQRTDLLPIYIGLNQPEVTSFAAGGLTTGLPYRFTVQAVNENGYSEESEIATYYSCQVPIDLASPTYSSSDQITKQIAVDWSTPNSNGGCPIIGYELYRNNGENDDLTIQIEDLVNTNPSLSSHLIDLSSYGVIGRIYRFKVRATNYAGYTDSSSISIALASLPEKPDTPPVSDDDVTNESRIGITIETFDSTNNGGSPILIYNIQYDDGNRGSFSDIFSLSPSQIISNVNAGAQYRFRYRARNFNGWGPLSDISYILAATRPSKPDAPYLISSTSTSVTFGFVPPSDTGGSSITSYQLWYDELNEIADFELIDETTILTAEVGVAQGLVAGEKYRFVVKAINQFGASDPSAEATVAIGRRPSTPNPVRKVESLSSLTTIVVEWDEVAAIDSITTTGYLLYIDDGRNGDFHILYDGTNIFFTLSFAATGLETGLPYRFYVIALNINGQSDQSDETTIYACVKPSDNGKPFKLGTTTTTVTLGWDEPTSEGCPLQSFSIFRDNGLAGVTEAIDIEVDAAIVSDKPSMREYKITGLTQTGNIYRFFVRAYNSAGFSDSSIVKIVLSSVPDTPASGPTSEAAETNELRISVLYGPQAENENGGSPILSYDLQIDRGEGAGFDTLIGG